MPVPDQVKLSPYIVSSKTRRGAMIALLAVCLPVMLILSAFCVNLASIDLTRTELRAPTDAAARAAGRKLAMDGNQAFAIQEGMDAAMRNTVAGEPFSLLEEDFVFGQSLRANEAERYEFTAGVDPVNAVQVLGRRAAGSAAGETTLFLNEFLGSKTFDVSQTSISTQVELDVVLILDRSGSMAYGYDETTPTNVYYPPNSAPAEWEFGDAAPPAARWRDTMDAVNVFFDQLTKTPQEERVALVTYSSDSTLDLQFTNNYADVMDALNVYTESFDSGSTNIGGGISTALSALQTTSVRPWAAKAIILLTDGNHNTGVNPISAAVSAAEQGVAIYSITFSNEANQQTMKQVAKKGKGKHFHADSDEDLIDAFEEAAASLPTLLTR